MGNINTKVNLAKLRNTQIARNKAGVLGIWIPIEENNLFVNEEKGNVYLDLFHGELKELRENSKDTHWVKQSLPQDKKREDDQFLGGSIDWSRHNNNTSNSTSASVISDAVVVEDDQSLPF